MEKSLKWKSFSLARLMILADFVLCTFAWPACSETARDTAGDDGAQSGDGPAGDAQTGDAQTDDVAHDARTHDGDTDDDTAGAEDLASDATIPGPLRLGEITSAVSGADCGQPAPAGATCWALTVDCPDIPPASAVVAVVEPDGDPLGTIVTHKGSEGTDFNTSIVSQVRDAGFRVALIRWESAWEATPDQGLLAAACRPATVTRWVFDEIHGADRTRAFCAHGHSGGAGAFAYGLAHYGLDTILDYVALSAGPPFARLDYGCVSSLPPSPPPLLCDDVSTPVSFALPPLNIDSWENTATCGAASPSSDEVARWAADSVVSPSADLDYPNTTVGFWDCMANPNGTTGGAWLYDEAISSASTRTCFTDCNGEGLGDAGLAALAQSAIDDCVPRH